MRELAEHDYDRYRAIVRWPLREALLAFVAKLKRDALDNYKHELSIWAALAPHTKKPADAPKLPPILKQ